MKNYSAHIKIISILFAIIFFYGCEDVITYELDNASPHIVIEGIISDGTDSQYVFISKSTDYFNPGSPEIISNALVTITDHSGNLYNLMESQEEPGLYYTLSLQPSYNEVYNLEVLTENSNYKATSTLLSPIKIDSLSYKLDKTFGDESYEFFAHFHDNPNRLDYGIFNYRKNGGKWERGELYDDRLTNGNNIKISVYDIEKDSINTGDVIEIWLRTIDADYYNFQVTLEATKTGSFSPSSPANPETNLTNDALGYFGAYSNSRRSIIVQE